MKRSRTAGKSKARGAGWAVEAFQASDDDDDLGQQPRQQPKDLHPHAIVNATPASTHSSIVNAFTYSQPILLPKTAHKPRNFLNTPPLQQIQAADSDDVFDMDIDSIFQEHNLMDPEISAAWDEDHGLKAKRARTASVSKPLYTLLDLFSDAILG